MPESQRSGARHHSRPASNYTEDNGSASSRQREVPWWAPNGWRDALEWWTSPALAYRAGLEDGVELERARREPEDEAAHRTAVRNAVRVVERAEHRERADRRGAAA